MHAGSIDKGDVNINEDGRRGSVSN